MEGPSKTLIKKASSLRCCFRGLLLDKELLAKKLSVGTMIEAWDEIGVRPKYGEGCLSELVQSPFKIMMLLILVVGLGRPSKVFN